MGHHHEQKVPRGVLLAAGGLILVTIGVAAGARSAREAEEARAPREPTGVSVELRFEDRADGSVAVLDPVSGEEITAIPPGSNGFVRGVLRGMFRTRKLESVDRALPFRLTREEDGRFVIADPHTGHDVELRSFGQTNRAAFERLFASAAGAR